MTVRVSPTKLNPVISENVFWSFMYQNLRIILSLTQRKELESKNTLMPHMSIPD